jgi:solute carrier family 35 protein E1
MFAAFKGSENKKVMDAPGLKDRLGGVGNQFAISTILAFFLSIPLALWFEGDKFADFLVLFQTNSVLFNNCMLSGMTFYLYNELSTMTIKQTGPVMQSVMNTAKRAIVIVGVALVMGEPLGQQKLIGCSIAIGGVFLYSLADKLFPAKKKSE